MGILRPTQPSGTRLNQGDRPRHLRPPRRASSLKICLPREYPEHGLIVVECTERISHGAVEEGCRGLPIQPAIDTASDALEVAGIGQLVQSVGFPEPRGRSAGLHRLLKQARLMQKVKAESSTTSKMVVVASNLNESVSLPPRPRSASCLRRGLCSRR